MYNNNNSNNNKVHRSHMHLINTFHNIFESVWNMFERFRSDIKDSCCWKTECYCIYPLVAQRNQFIDRV